ncbi:hypothetical protein LVJ82_17205 [Vitreoscilla massiliensis]|uniref:Uncharacterized protein n=1 Tax=Vitreoscilla massiliensis TaxID=1689272 RepID=A0ABY4E1H1_9NEIS|nr:hypothetical protein [Vitreoscilla massiliensis]UOO89158.1 hypothetical protein LVJ82_17205 [Vitreoscilla massiliensis]
MASKKFPKNKSGNSSNNPAEKQASTLKIVVGCLAAFIAYVILSVWSDWGEDKPNTESTSQQVKPVPQAPVQEVNSASDSSKSVAPPVVSKPVFSDIEICKATNAILFGRDVKIMKVANEKDLIIYYLRPNDNSKWSNQCKIEGNSIVWRSVQPDGSFGRWRTDAEDEKLSFVIEGDKITITKQYSDGSNSAKTYQKKQFK